MSICEKNIVQKKLKQGAEALGIDWLREETVDRLIWFAEELLRWNSRINLTSIRVMDDVVEKHLLDSLALVGPLGQSERILDVGSGAGIPVIPLALTLPDRCFFSLDSVGKKINFQKHIKRQLGLKNLQIQCARIEEIKQINSDWQNFDVIVARAVAHLNELLKMVFPLLKPGGALIAMKGSEVEARAELSSLDTSWQNTCDVPEKIVTYQLPFSDAERCLIRIAKKAD